MILAGIAIGVLNGTIVAKLKVPPFIVTLAGLTAYRGLAMALTGAANLPVTNKSFSSALGSGSISANLVMVILGLGALVSIYVFLRNIKKTTVKKLYSVAVLALSLAGLGYLAYLVNSVGALSIQIVLYAVVLLATYILLNKTIFGRHIYAVGDNSVAAKMAGINVDRTLIKIYSFGGFCAAFTGILMAAKLQSGMPSAGVGGELDAIAAVVIGGTSLSGGTGKLTGTIVGVLLIGVLNNMLSLLNVSTDMQSILKGVIILSAVIIDMKFKK